MIGRTAVCWLLPGLLPLASACAFESGGGFTSLAPGELHLVFEPGGRASTDRGYRVQVNALSVHVHEFTLLEVGETEASFSEIAHVAIDRELDLLGGEEIELAPFEPSTELGAGRLERAELLVERVAASAVVEGGSLEAPLSIETQVDAEVSIAAQLALVLDREVPERIAPIVELRAAGTLFDAIDFGALAGDDGRVETRLAAWIATAELEVDLGVLAHDRPGRAHDHEAEGHTH